MPPRGSFLHARSVKPMMPLSGVRISWLIWEEKVFLGRRNLPVRFQLGLHLFIFTCTSARRFSARRPRVRNSGRPYSKQSRPERVTTVRMTLAGSWFNASGDHVPAVRCYLDNTVIPSTLNNGLHLSQDHCQPVISRSAAPAASSYSISRKTHLIFAGPVGTQK